MELVIDRQGRGHCVYDELCDLSALGTLLIKRASQVEPDSQGHWHADLSPLGGPTLGPFPQRSQALAAELDWLHRHWLTRQS